MFSFRIFNADIAEMLLAATAVEEQRKGYAEMLLGEVLRFLQAKVRPAAQHTALSSAALHSTITGSNAKACKSQHSSRKLSWSCRKRLPLLPFACVILPVGILLLAGGELHSATPPERFSLLSVFPIKVVV